MFSAAKRLGGSRLLTMPLWMPLVSGLIILSLFLRLMNFDLRRDEQLYVPPARLLDDQSLYQDFFYNHMPGSAWLFYAMRWLIGSEQLLFDARLGVFAAWLLLIGGIAAVSYALTRSQLISWSIVVLSLSNELLLSVTGMTATNNLLPLPFAYIGLGLFVIAVSWTRLPSFLIAAAGLCLSIGATFKISGVAFILPTAVAAFLIPRRIALQERLTRVVLPLAAGGVVGALPVLFYLLSDPSRFLAHVIGYHQGPHAQYWLSAGSPDEGAVTTQVGKLTFAYEIWIGANAVPLLALVLVALLRWGGRPTNRGGTGTLLLFSVFVFSVAAAFSLLPTPSFPQYFAAPLVCLPLVLALLVGDLTPEARDRARAVLLSAAAVALLAQAPRLVQHFTTLVDPERWVVAKVHAAGAEIARHLSEAQRTGKVATLAPLYPLEGGVPVYPELATGLFAYRTAAITEPYLARHYRMVSPAGIPDLLDADPPSALLLGFEEALEKPLLDYARSHGYLPVPDFRIPDRYGVGLLYMRPGLGTTALSNIPEPY